MQRLATVGLVALGVVIGAGISEWLRPREAVGANKITYDVLYARYIVLVDEKGTKRAMMGTKGGDVMLGFFDAQENPRVSMGVIDGSAMMGLSDPDGTERVQLSLAPNRVCSLAMLGTTGRRGVILGCQDDVSSLAFYDARARRRALLGTAGSTPSLQFFDAAEKRTLALP